MSRIAIIDPQTAAGETRDLLEAVRAQLGVVPNFIRVLANSPSALKAFLGLFQIAGSGTLEAPTRERIALAVAQQNTCEYCLSAHTALGRNAGLGGDEIAANRQGSSLEARAAVAVAFARSLMENTGDVTSAEIEAVRQAGYGDAEIVEIIVHVALNALTNILGKASRVEIDFPKVSAGALAATA